MPSIFDFIFGGQQAAKRSTSSPFRTFGVTEGGKNQNMKKQGEDGQDK